MESHEVPERTRWKPRFIAVLSLFLFLLPTTALAAGSELYAGFPAQVVAGQGVIDRVTYRDCWIEIFGRGLLFYQVTWGTDATDLTVSLPRTRAAVEPLIPTGESGVIESASVSVVESDGAADGTPQVHLRLAGVARRWDFASPDGRLIQNALLPENVVRTSRFDLWVGPTRRLSELLARDIATGLIGVRYIP